MYCYIFRFCNIMYITRNVFSISDPWFWTFPKNIISIKTLVSSDASLKNLCGGLFINLIKSISTGTSEHIWFISDVRL